MVKMPIPKNVDSIRCGTITNPALMVCFYVFVCFRDDIEITRLMFLTGCQPIVLNNKLVGVQF